MSGLNVGDVIVTRGIHMIRDGADISVKNPEVFNVGEAAVELVVSTEVEIIEGEKSQLITPESGGFELDEASSEDAVEDGESVDSGKKKDNAEVK